MSKYVSDKGGSRVSCWHFDPECTKLKHTSREARPGEIAYHDLTPCGRCAKPKRPSHSQQDWSYQELQGALESEGNQQCDRCGKRTSHATYCRDCETHVARVEARKR